MMVEKTGCHGKGLIMRKISVILVNYNGGKYNDNCIKSLLQSTIASEMQIIIVDNASTDNSLQCLQDKWGSNEQIVILPLERNFGFSKANNVGIEWAEKSGSEYFLLLNNDTEIAEDAIEKMIDIHQKTGGIIVPKIVYADKPDVIWYAGGSFSKVIWKPIQRGFNQKDVGQYNQSEQCTFANGCSMLLSRQIIQKIGLLDEQFFLYYEDTEYSLRAKQNEISIWYCAEAVVYHKVNGSTLGNERPDGAYYIARNWLICNHKCMKKRFAFFLCYYVLNRFSWIVIWFVTNKKKNIIATVEGIIDYRKGISGQYVKNSL